MLQTLGTSSSRHQCDYVYIYAENGRNETIPHSVTPPCAKGRHKIRARGARKQARLTE
jgi:hypothetical protein